MRNEGPRGGCEELKLVIKNLINKSNTSSNSFFIFLKKIIKKIDKGV